ncbi:MAG: response regulator [Nitrospiraceae bacterium]|nr:response regulator [Nitrospiraceae bacterium]
MRNPEHAESGILYNMFVDLSRKKILVIDDFSDFRKALRKMMESYGAKNVDEASNGEAAMEKLEIKSYDIVLCDYNLGDGKKDGQQILEDAKHRGFIKYSCIYIMCTAENTMAMVMGAIEYQPDDYLVKPFSKEMLLNRLEKVMKKKKDFEDIERAIQKKDYMEAITLCDWKLAENPKNRFEYLRLKGDLLLKAAMYDDSIELYNEVIAIRDLPWAQTGLGKAYFYLNNFEKAKEIFQYVVDTNVTYMEAYDWLAKTMDELGALKEAQDVLLNAVDISPKSILRQKAIGEIAYKNEDYDTSEKSFRTVLTLGKNSYLKSPTDFTGLAKTLVEKKAGDEALNVLGAIKSEFKNDNAAALQAAIAEGIVYKKLDRGEESRKALEEAANMYENLAEQTSPDISMELAKAYFTVGETEKGTQMMKDIVRNHHEDDTVIKKVQGVFTDMKLSEEGADIISATRQEIIRINNAGVRLVEEGRLKEAIEYFEKAAAGQPDNKIINANAALSVMLFMQKQGMTEQHMKLAGQYIERIRKVDPAHKKLPQLLQMFRSLAETRPQ